MEKTITQKYNEWENSLWEKYDKDFPNVQGTIYDGVIFPEEYAVEPFKVLIMNREPYDDDPENSYSLTDEIAKRISNGTNIWENQKLLKCRLRQYLSVIEYCLKSKSFLQDESDVVNYVDSAPSWDFPSMIRKTAYINVKKSDGHSTSNTDDLRKYAKQGLDILKNQISYFNPSIILGGDIVDNVLEPICEWGEDLYRGEGINVCQLKIDDKFYPLVDMWHPSSRASWKDMPNYYKKFYNAIKDVETKHPNYWETHMNQECFR